METSADKILTKLPKEIVIFVEELDVVENGALLDKQFPKMKSVLKSGFSQLLLHPESATDPKSSLFYFLSFENSFTKEELSKTTPKADTVRLFTEKQAGDTSTKPTQDDDELTEVKYPNNPRTIKDLTTMSVGIWTNTSAIAELSEQAGINYFYSSKPTASSSELWNQFEGLLAIDNLDILLIHFALNEEITKSSFLQSIDELAGAVEGKVFLKVIVGPFGKKKYEQTAILQSHLEAIKEDSVLKDLEGVLPRQTYQFNRAEVNKELVDTPLRFLFCFSLNNEKKGSRTDNIENFEMLGQKENLRKFGGGKINIAGLFREITFELGKLPKFGA